jgi:transposase
MNLKVHDLADLSAIGKRIQTEPNARKRDRFRAVLMALEGQTRPSIAASLHRTRKFVENWVYAYRDHGLAALAGKGYRGSKPKLTAEQDAWLIQRLKEGAKAEDGVCALRGKDIIQLVQAQFGVVYSGNGVYDLLKRLNFSCLRPRPRHPKNDPAAMDRFKADSPLLATTSSNGIPTRSSASFSRMKPASDNKEP